MTIAIVTAPIALATLAATEMAPVPVPPPMPAVRKTISAPSIASAITRSLSSAACFPIAGLPPAPKPRDTSGPR